MFRKGGREGDVFYRDRWSHDKVVRSTHGVNCTGLVLVEGLRQGRDHHLGDPADRLPVGGPGLPGVRAARLPARRRVLLVHLLAHPGALPVRPRRAGGDVPGGEGPARRPGARRGPRSSTDPDKRRRYQSARGKGGHVRVSWDEAVEIVAAAHVHTIKAYGPDRIAGFSPDPGDVDGQPRGRARGSSS